MAFDSPHINACMAEGEAAGWSGAALARMVIDPKSGSMAGFRAKLAEAANIRALVTIVAPQMRGAGFDPDTAADYFVANGHSYEAIRNDTVHAMATHDESKNIDSTQKRKPGTDVFASRAAEIDAYNAKKNV